MEKPLDTPHERLEWARRRAGFASKAAFADAAGVPQVTYRAYENGQNGFAKSAALFARKLGVSAEWLLEGGPEPMTTPPSPAVVAAPKAEEVDAIEMVGIQHIDMAYGLGTTFAVDYPDVEVLRFPKAWIETITHAPPATLTWTRGKGDSMEPTIRDGDLVLLDRSQRVLTERDAMWAFTIGEEAAIKRLRRQGEVCEIFSDNPNVPPDKQMLRDMNIVGRVVFVGSRK
jgi:phage repressor protein C with HTH and peptisase S24 domain